MPRCPLAIGVNIILSDLLLIMMERRREVGRECELAELGVKFGRHVGYDTGATSPRLRLRSLRHAYVPLGTGADHLINLRQGEPLPYIMQ